MVTSLNIAILYDDQATYISTVREHLASFRKYSKHNIYYLPASGFIPDGRGPGGIGASVDLGIFDVIVHHYSIRLALPNHLSEEIARQVEIFKGFKILFIQDEYDTTNTALQWMDRLQFDLVYTCVPEEWRNDIYPRVRFPNTRFLGTLTGYIPEDSHIDGYAMPIEQRPLYIGYRGRMLPYWYGMLGYEKYIIGVEVKRLAQDAGMPVDIEVCDQTKRINGLAWYAFLGSCRASLGTESGSNVFDFDGSIHKRVKEVLSHDSGLSFQQVYDDIVRPHEGPVQMNQVSPKIFECIRLRTALILFEGSYSGVVEPEKHFIPLKKDFSNIADVFQKLEDIDYLKAMTERAYNDVVASGLYSYQRFIEGFDANLLTYGPQMPRYEIYSSPIAVRGYHDMKPRLTGTQQPAGLCLNTGILYGDFMAADMITLSTSRELRNLPALLLDYAKLHLIRRPRQALWARGIRPALRYGITRIARISPLRKILLRIVPERYRGIIIRSASYQ